MGWVQQLLHCSLEADVLLLLGSSVEADLWGGALARLLGDGLSQGLQSGDDIQNPQRVFDRHLHSLQPECQKRCYVFTIYDQVLCLSFIHLDLNPERDQLIVNCYYYWLQLEGPQFSTRSGILLLFRYLCGVCVGVLCILDDHSPSNLSSRPAGIYDFAEFLCPACNNLLVYLVSKHPLHTRIAPSSVQGARDTEMKRPIPFPGGPIDLVGRQTCR